MPLSYRTDREAVEWAFSALLMLHVNDSCDSLLDWISSLQKSNSDPLRLTILFDPADSFSAGTVAVLLPFLRQRLGDDSVSISIVGIPETVSVSPGPFFRDLGSSLQMLRDRALLKETPQSETDSSEKTLGADVMFFAALPVSIAENPDSHRLIFLSAARAIAGFFSSGTRNSGLQVLSVDSALSLSSLGSEAESFSAFLLASSWLVSDLFPLLLAQAAHSGRFRSLQLNVRSGILKNIVSSDSGAVTEILPALTRSFKSVLSEVVSLIRSLPDDFFDSAENELSWQRISNACGRFVTVASEYDVTRSEFEESGLSGIRPVHRESLADTADELQQRRIEDMANQVSSESAALDEIIKMTGPVRVLQAEHDCFIRCREALSAAESKLASLPQDTDHLTLVQLDRRVRLLKAAVARCESDLLHRVPDPKAFYHPLPSASKPSCILSADYLKALDHWIHEENESSCRDIREAIPAMVEGYSIPDVKDLLKDLSALCKAEDVHGSLVAFLDHVITVCSRRIRSVSFAQPVLRLPPVPLLPCPVLSESLDSLSALLAVISHPTGHPEVDSEFDESELRGILAMLLLRWYRRVRPDEARLDVSILDSSAFLPRTWLSARHAACVHLFSLSSPKNASFPFALIIPGKAAIPAKRTRDHAQLIPDFVTWYNPDTDIFRDPCGDLSEGDHELLLSLLTKMTDRWAGPAGSPLFSFLSSFRNSLAAERISDPDVHLRTRLLAVCGLMHLGAYGDSIRKTSCFYEHFLDDDPIASALSGCGHFPAEDCVGLPDNAVYSWRGIPFARENNRLILESSRAPEEDHALRMLERECEILSGISDDYRDALVRESGLLLERFPNAISEHRDAVQHIISKASKPLSDQSPELQWPWDPLSPSVQTVLRECLSESLASAAACPFSDMLTVFPARGGDVIRDTLFGAMCVVNPFVSGAMDPASAIQPDAVLPPLSPEWASALCHFPEGRTLFTPDLIRLERPDESSCRVTMTLNGNFPLRLTRVYQEDETIRLYSNDIPTVALWPSLPLPANLWHMYFVYTRLPDMMELDIITDPASAPIPVETSGTDRIVTSFPLFPSVFLFRWNGHSSGILPNLLPSPQLESKGETTVSIDFGSVGTSVIFSDGSGRRPLHGPTMVRTILNNPAASQDLLRREFLPAVPVSALLPTASRIFRNVPGADPVPFVDGIILMSSSLQDLLSTPSDALYTCLKWEEEKGRSGLLCLHQILLMASLQARMEGADSLALRFAIPDEMAREGRESLRRLFCSLTETVLVESGYFHPEEDLPVSFASESAALGAYFRYCAWEDTRGGFMVTDIGASTVDISLFLRGREQAVRACQIPLGVHYMLLPSLLRDPEMLLRDFGGCPDPVFHTDLELLTRILSSARTDPVSLRKARMSLDHFLADHYTFLLSACLQYSAAGMSSRFGAVLLLHLSYLMMLSGLVLLQIAADPNKNDFLPEQMTLCLSGRGSLLLESLPDSLKTALWRFLTMFRNKRVASMSLLFSAEKKMEIPVGLSMLQQLSSQLPPASAVPTSIAVRPEELLPEFLLRFARVFPLEAASLFPGFFTGDYYHPFSPAGEAAVTAAITRSFTETDTPRPYDSLAAWIGNLLDS